jgi:hypothetical protein
MWRNPEVETVRVWQKLSQSWGVPVTAVGLSDDGQVTPDTESETSSGLVAHAGILDMAQELYVEMRPQLLKHSGALSMPDLHSSLRIITYTCALRNFQNIQIHRNAIAWYLTFP